MKYSNKFSVLAISLAAIAVSSCGKDSVESASQPTAAPVVEESSMARNAPDAGSIERVAVKATGQGPTVQVAVDQAIRLAYEQVNGKAFEAATVSVDAGFKGQFGDSSIEASSSAYADVIVTQTQGAVSDFRLLSQSESDGVVSVQIEASVEQFVKPESAGQLRVAFAPLRTDRSSFSVGGKSVSSADIAQQVTDTLSQAVLKSRRATVLDREFDADLQRELGRIDASNWQNSDRLRLGQQLAADFLVVGRLDRFDYTKHTRKLRSSDREIVSYSGGASLLVRVINVATGQVQISETFNVELPETKPTSLGQSINVDKIVTDLVAGISAPASRQVTLSLFPITIVDVDGEDVVLSQGGDLVEEGQLYEVVLRGKEIKDPQTGGVIGRIEKPCCTILVTTVTPEMSYGIVTDSRIPDVGTAFSPGALELRGKVAQAPQPVAAQAVASAPAKPVQQSAPRPSPQPEEVEEDSDW